MRQCSVVGILTTLILGSSAWMVLAAPSASASVQVDEAAAGKALFMGQSPLTGRIASHLTNLPTEVLRCANCHSAKGLPPVARTIAPPLTREWLLQAQARRGGPPSAYDLAQFCTLLRTGHDAAQLIANAQMPRYVLNDQECKALWVFLVDEKNE